MKRRFNSVRTLCALLLAATAGNAAAAELIGDFTDVWQAQRWTLTSEPTYLAETGMRLQPLTMDGTGWLKMMANGRPNQIAYVTSQTPISTQVPLRIRYEFVSYNLRSTAGGAAGFHLIDATQAPELHVAGKAFECASSPLFVSFSHESPYAAECGGQQDAGWFNQVIVRADNQVFAKQEAPVWLSCGNYDVAEETRVDERHCATRKEAIAGFVHQVEALVTPSVFGDRYVLDLSIDGQVVYDKLMIERPLPQMVTFGLWGDHAGRPHHEVRNLHVAHDFDVPLVY